MKTSHFVTSILILMVAFFILHFFIIESAASINYKIGAITGSVIGSLFWGVILWVPARLVLGKEKSPEIRKFVLITAFIFAILYITMTIFGITNANN